MIKSWLLTIIRSIPFSRPNLNATLSDVTLRLAFFQRRALGGGLTTYSAGARFGLPFTTTPEKIPQGASERTSFSSTLRVAIRANQKCVCRVAPLRVV